MNQQPGEPLTTIEGYNENIGGTAISRSIWTWARVAGGMAILAVLVWRWGAGPFVDGLRLTTAWALAAAVAITSLTGRRLLSCHRGRTSRSWWCTVTDRWSTAACARRRLAYDGAWARSSGRCLHAPASQPVNHAAASAA